MLAPCGPLATDEIKKEVKKSGFHPAPGVVPKILLTLKMSGFTG
jgi:hypothetical protein